MKRDAMTGAQLTARDTPLHATSTPEPEKADMLHAERQAENATFVWHCRTDFWMVFFA